MLVGKGNGDGRGRSCEDGDWDISDGACSEEFELPVFDFLDDFGSLSFLGGRVFGRFVRFEFFGGCGVALFHALLPLVVECGAVSGDFEIGNLRLFLFGSVGNATVFAYGFNLDHGDALGDDAELLGCTPREIDDASADEGTSVGDAHDDLPSVGGVLHPQERSEGIGAMGTGHAVVVEAFAVGGSGSSGALGIESGLAFLYGLRRKS